MDLVGIGPYTFVGINSKNVEAHVAICPIGNGVLCCLYQPNNIHIMKDLKCWM
jgi:hypothetical protein